MVEPLLSAPAASSSLSNIPTGTFCEPMNMMCSNRCANPVRPSFLVAGADLVPGIDGHDRSRVILVEDDLEPVRQRVLLELDFGNCLGAERHGCRPWPAIK